MPVILPDRCPNCQAPYVTELSNPINLDGTLGTRTRYYACGWFIQTTPWGTFEEKSQCLRQGIVDMGVYVYPKPLLEGITQVHPASLKPCVFAMPDPSFPCPPLPVKRREEFLKRLEDLVNEYSMESTGGNTPDFFLAEYLLECLENFGRVVGKRDAWYGRGVGEISEAPCSGEEFQP